MIHFEEKSYPEDIFEYLNYLRSIYCVVDIAVMHYTGSENVDEYAFSKGAALAGMDVFRQRYEKRFYKSNPDKNINDYFNIKINGEPSGEKISLETFLGPFYDFSTGSILPFQDSEQKPLKWLYGRGLEDGDASIYGFVDALLNPPYGLRIEDRDRIKVVHFFLEYFLKIDIENGTLNEPLFIVEWSKDWSNYFDPGKDWWGTFFWTIFLRYTREFVIVGASTTD